MELKNGGLYETKHGARFRVHIEDGLFVCRSFGGYWDKEGRASCKVWINGDYRKPHLVREVDESRWIPASRERWVVTPNHLRCSDGKHHQILVDLEYARALGQEGHKKAALRLVAASEPEVATPAKSGQVRFTDGWGYTSGFDWKFIDDGSFLEITTTLDDVLKVRV